MDTINEVKMLSAKKGITLTQIAKYLSDNSEKDYNIDKLSKKLRADTIRYQEMKLIVEDLNMQLVFQDVE